MEPKIAIYETIKSPYRLSNRQYEFGQRQLANFDTESAE